MGDQLNPEPGDGMDASYRPRPIFDEVLGGMDAARKAATVYRNQVTQYHVQYSSIDRALVENRADLAILSIDSHRSPRRSKTYQQADGYWCVDVEWSNL